MQLLEFQQATKTRRMEIGRIGLFILLTIHLVTTTITAVHAGRSPVCKVESNIQRALKSESVERRPTILFWDKEGVNYEMYPVWFGENGYLHCPVQCNIETGRSLGRLKSAEAVMFWSTPLNKELDLKEKCPSQLWIQASTEAADTTILDRTPPQGLMANGEPSPIDFEVSWRRSLGSEKVVWMNNFDWNLDFTRAFNQEFQQPLAVKTKTIQGRDPDQAAVAAFISNCGATSNRLELLGELQKYIQVDSFGRCMHNKEIPEHWHAEKDVSRGLLMQKNTILKNRYKFLLAFENQEIEDYVTEKFYHPLAIGVLPIVLGAPNIDEYAPNLPQYPKAFLNIRDFPSMEALANKIIELDRNDTAYMEFFAWRSSSQFSPLFRDAVQYSWRDVPCQVCQKVHHELYGYTPISILPEVWNRRKPRPNQPKQANVHDEL